MMHGLDLHECDAFYITSMVTIQKLKKISRIFLKSLDSCIQNKHKPSKNTSKNVYYALQILKYSFFLLFLELGFTTTDFDSNHIQLSQNIN